MPLSGILLGVVIAYLLLAMVALILVTRGRWSWLRAAANWAMFVVSTMIAWVVGMVAAG